jgi:hypothetical protein
MFDSKNMGSKEGQIGFYPACAMAGRQALEGPR